MVRPSHPPGRRPGSMIPLLALTVVGLFAFCALAIDIGMIAVARTECQNAADSAALVSTRNLDNKPTSTNSNQANANTAANTTVNGNVIYNVNMTAANVTSIRYGVYDYDPVAQLFKVTYPAAPAPGRSWTATEVVVSSTQPQFFARVFGMNMMGVGAGTVPNLQTSTRAVAVHRPRDVALILDLTGSMRFGSMRQSGNGGAFQGIYNSADPVYPQFGHWARYKNYLVNNPGTSSNNDLTTEANNTNPFFTTTPTDAGSNGRYAPNNYTVPTAGGPPAVQDFYYDPANLANPAGPVTTPAPSMAAVAPATPLPKGFHNYDPGVVNPGDPDNYIAPTYDYSGWTYTPGGLTHYPCPEAFKDQSASTYLGDKWPRKKGAEWTVAAGTSWDVTTATGAAVNLAEYLGWAGPYTSGGSTPTPNSAANRPALPAGVAGRVPTPTAAKADWSDFRDATWEQYGYDLNVPHYIANRGAAFDPRAVYAGAQVSAGRYKGYSMGPGYWGKTFFVWPPDPRTPVGTTVGTPGYVAGDWRRRFFLSKTGTALVTAAPGATATNNTLADNLASTTGAGNNESVGEVVLNNGIGSTVAGYSTTHTINYAAVLRWIKQPPLALPPNLRAGRVVYYTSIPDDVTGGTVDAAFWKNYIDYIFETSQVCEFENAGYPSGATSGVFQADLGRYQNSLLPPMYDPQPYMHYLDNPSRPRGQFWFGPISMMAFLANVKGGQQANAWAATTHESQTWQLKAGVKSALIDIRNNHPNDSVGLGYFSAGDYGFISVACGQEWQMLQDALFYPQTMLDDGSVADPTKEFAAFDTSCNWRGMSNVPNAQRGTDPNTGMALGFNILSPSPSVALRPRPPSPYVSATAPRSGRRGAAKILVFETDGVPNSLTTGTAFNPAGYNSYYTVSTITGGGDPVAPALAIVDQIVAPMANSTTGPSGLSSPNSPARVYSIGFGDLFSVANTASTNARTFLLQVQQHGKTSSASDTAIPPSQIITGPYQARIDGLRTCLEQILQSGVQVTLVE